MPKLYTQKKLEEIVSGTTLLELYVFYNMFVDSFENNIGYTDFLEQFKFTFEYVKSSLASNNAEREKLDTFKMICLSKGVFKR